MRHYRHDFEFVRLYYLSLLSPSHLCLAIREIALPTQRQATHRRKAALNCSIASVIQAEPAVGRDKCKENFLKAVNYIVISTQLRSPSSQLYAPTVVHLRN